MAVNNEIQRLFFLIHKQHLGCFENDANDDSRGKLEENIHKFLCLVPHSLKFVLNETKEVLHKSCTSEKFDGRKAVNAWKAIQKYACNLFAQPWRKEFRNLKLYSGFYKHEVEEHLVDAELMFEVMGYCHAGSSIMTNADVLDPDKILSVSRDAVVASVECKIMTEIWKKLHDISNFTWWDIFEYRQHHIGTPDQAICHFMYRHQKNQYQAAENHVRSDYMFASSAGYLNQMYSSPSYSLHGTGLGGPQILPPSVHGPAMHSLNFPQYGVRPLDVYGHNENFMYQYCPPQTSSSRSLQDGCPDHCGYYCQHRPSGPPPGLVSTGQLNDLDPPSHNLNDKVHTMARYFAEEDPSHRWPEKNGSVFPSGKAKAEGGPDRDPWDHALKNFGDQGFKKSSRREPSAKGSSYARSSSNSIPDTKIQAELVEKIKKMSTGQSSSNKSDANSKSMSETEDLPRSKSVRTASKVALYAPKEQDKVIVPDVRSSDSSPQKGKKSPTTVSARKHSSSSSSSGSRKKEIASGNGSGSDRSKGRKSSLELNNDTLDEGWTCKTCTFLNPIHTNICEMCAKSKDVGDESKPQPTGGQECRNCTLVNEPSKNFCAACDKPLIDDPTYI